MNWVSKDVLEMTSKEESLEDRGTQQAHGTRAHCRTESWFFGGLVGTGV